MEYEMKPTRVLILGLILFLYSSCHNSKTDSSMSSEHKPRESFVETEQMKLQYLDWGGQGQVLVFICGLGDTPFIFDSLAKDLSDNFHVIGYSRRYHGKSKATDNKFDNASLVSDLKLLYDSLRIDSASLLGWSMGGNEITEFSALYPERVNKLIYFESGYDLSDGGFAKLVSNIPKSYLPDNSSIQSLDKYREWYHRFWFGDIPWNSALEANLLASTHVNYDGSVTVIPEDKTFRSILTEGMNYRRRYENVQSPSLVIYAKSFFFPADSNTTTIELYNNIERNIASPWRSVNKRRIAAELKNSVIVDAPHGSHTSFLFLSHDFLVKTISNFLFDKK